MSNLMRSWKESLQFFWPSNLVPFVMVVLKSLVDLYWVMLRNILLVGVPLLVAAIALVALYAGTTIGIFGPSLFITVINTFVAFFVSLCIVSARPSVEVKDLKYFSRNALFGVAMMALLLFFGVFSGYRVPYGLVYPFLLFTFFFLCDSDYDIRRIVMAPVLAARMIVLKAPIFALLAVLILLTSGPVIHMYAVPFLAQFFYVAVYIPLIVVIVSRLYVLWVHQDYEHYYGNH